MQKKILWIIPLCLFSHTIQAYETKEKQAIVSWIKADEGNRTLTPAEAKIFLQLVESYSSYQEMIYDLQVNVMGSPWFKPWYEVSLKASLISSLTSSLYIVKAYFDTLYSPKDLIKKLYIEQLFKDHGYGHFKGVLLVSLLASIPFFCISFMISFCLTATITLVGNNISNTKKESTSQAKHKFCRYLVKRRIHLYADYYHNLQNSVIGLLCFLSTVLLYHTTSIEDKILTKSLHLLGIEAN